MTSGAAPIIPAPPVLPAGDPRTKLSQNLKDALIALPGYFKSDTVIEGINATDLFALNSSLGATIEVQVVETLNVIRRVWDPDEEWPEYRFERRSQSFPDVRLVSGTGAATRTAIGVELKGWYLLAKEGVPSFRYQVAASACEIYDMLVVVPWRLKNILSGSPIAHAPYVESARYAAEARNYWWQHVRATSGNIAIASPGGATPYPLAKTDVNDRPADDAGGNFGRIPRLKDSLPEFKRYLDAAILEPVAGIEARHWINFFKGFTDDHDAEETFRRLQDLLQKRLGARSAEVAAEAAALVQQLTELLRVA